MSAMVRAGEKGVDFSFSKPPAYRLVELGYTFIVGYISVPPANTDKNLTKEQVDAYLAAGLKVLLVWEINATRANLGDIYGAMDGASAKKLAEALGYPADVPILVAIDTNTDLSDIDAQAAYIDSFIHTCWPYNIGIYGDTDILTRCQGQWQIGWLPNAWAWSAGSRLAAEDIAHLLGAHVFQYKGFYIDGTWPVDPNVAQLDFPAWGLVNESSISKDEDMEIHFCKDDGPGNFWAFGVDSRGQWACMIQELGTPDYPFRWELYELDLPVRPRAVLDAVHRPPVWPVTSVSVPSVNIDLDAIAEAVANKLAGRMAA